MAKAAFSGPLEHIDTCCYRIPKELQARHARGRPHLRQREADRADPQGPGARAGRQRRVPARHPDGQPGDAGHSLGLRLLHRRRLRDRPGRGRRHLARRRRLRHQLRRAPRADEPLLSRRQAAHSRRSSKELFHSDSRRRRPVGQVQVRRQGTAPAHGRRAASSSSAAISASPRDLEHTEADGRIRRRRPGRRHRPRRASAARSSAARSAPATTSWKCRSSIASSTTNVAKVFGLEKDQVCVMIHSGSRGLGYQVCDDALAQFRNVPDEVRHRPARPPAGLRPGRQPGRAASTSPRCAPPPTSPSATGNC